jgi:hypothetical protein
MTCAPPLVLTVPPAGPVLAEAAVDVLTSEPPPPQAATVATTAQASKLRHRTRTSCRGLPFLPTSGTRRLHGKMRVSQRI